MAVSNTWFMGTQNCDVCPQNTDEYELLEVGSKFLFGDYAMVVKDGKIQRVSLSRVYDVK
jgi:hypothetical protein